jgi:alpha-tubulin suppressor-like RCC1 family protein
MSPLKKLLIACALIAPVFVVPATSVGAHGAAGGTTTALAASGQTLALGGSHACAIVDGKVYCWGDNAKQQLGSLDSNLAASNVPVEVSGISTAVAVTAGFAHSCALLANGDVWCWGSNESKEVGRASGVSGTPAKMTGLSGVTAISAGNATTCALVGAAGEVKCWGANGSIGSMLGRTTSGGTNDADPVPGTVTGLSSGVRAVSVGGGSACVLMTDKTLKCWGSNWEGRLGNGDTQPTTDTSGPVSVVGLTDVAAVSVGSAHACAVVSSGKTYCWGQWESGQLGIDRGINDYAEIVARGGGKTPLEVLNARGSTDLLLDAKTISAGQSFACAARSAGAVSCWGLNSAGELGTGGKSSYILAPVTIASLTDVVYVAASNSFACALMTDKSVKCWGAGGFTSNSGQLGNGTNSESLVPTDVKGVAPQTLTFGELTGKSVTDAAFTVTATASSGGAVSFESTTTSVCTVSGATVTLVAPGTCTISASRAAYGLYKAATAVTQSFKVTGLKPVVKTGTATPQSTKATLRGTVNAGGSETTVNFVYGTDPALKGGTTVKATAQSSSKDEEVLAVVTDLKESTKYYFRIEATNAIGSAAGEIGSFTTIGPEGVSINDGDEFTNSVDVVVSVVGPSNATKILVSNDGGFKNASPFDLTNSAANVPWKLVASRDGTFTKTVYVRFLSRFDSKVTDDKTDDIILDTSKPKVNTVTASASAAPASAVTVSAARLGAKAKASTGVKLNVRASDTISGAVAIEVRSAANKPATVVPLGKAPSKVKTVGMPRLTAAAITVKSTAKVLQIRAIDGAGNTSAWVRVTVKR